jgi:D-sedoheptulose 7-phosphate isomerase
MRFTEHACSYLNELKDTLDRIPVAALAGVYEEIERAYDEDGHVFLIGNGGSAANASHFACDLGKGTVHPGRRRLRAAALADSAPIATAYANDLAYDQIFAEPIRSLARPGDLVIALSGSGNSPNVLQGVAAAREVGARTVALTGFRGGRIKDLADRTLIIPSESMQHIEDCHLILAHLIFQAVRAHVAEAPAGVRTLRAPGAGPGPRRRRVPASV